MDNYLVDWLKDKPGMMPFTRDEIDLIEKSRAFADEYLTWGRVGGVPITENPELPKCYRLMIVVTKLIERLQGD